LIFRCTGVGLFPVAALRKQRPQMQLAPIVVEPGAEVAVDRADCPALPSEPIRGGLRCVRRDFARNETTAPPRGRYVAARRTGTQRRETMNQDQQALVRGSFAKIAPIADQAAAPFNSYNLGLIAAQG
jgi:hypothetical protein